MSKKLTHTQMNSQNWRYKKKRPPTDEFSHMNGPVKVIKPSDRKRLRLVKKSRKPKTEGYVWLEHSITAFNGSGYADRDSPEAFLDSYIDYKKWKRRPQGVQLANQFYEIALTLCQYLIDESPGPSHQPSAKNYDKFRLSRQTKLI